MRRTLIYSLVIVLIAVSCKAHQIDHESVYGNFYNLNKDKDFSKSYTLELNQDGSFKFIIKQLDARPQCKGKWKLEGNEVLIECEEAQVYEMISSGYLSQREHSFQVLNKNKLKYNGMVLKRKKLLGMPL